MANEKRLIDSTALLAHIRDRMYVTYPNLYPGMFKAQEIIKGFQTVDAVEVEKYQELVERYHELRENFIDYYCSGIPNVAPYCLNKCEECVTVHGWCNFNSDKCKGFNPAEVILDGESKDNA